MTTLATTIHDSHDRLYHQMYRQWPNNIANLSAVAVNAIPNTNDQLLNIVGSQKSRFWQKKDFYSHSPDLLKRY